MLEIFKINIKYKDMIKTLVKSKYLPSSLQISSLRKKLKISKNDMAKELKAVNIKGFSPRTYLRFENQENKFELNKFEDLAKGFIKISKKKKIDIGEVYSTNLIEKDSVEDNKNSVTKLLALRNTGDLIKLIHSTNRKKIFGLETILSNARPTVKEILDCISELNKSSPRITSDESPNDFDVENELLDISSALNSRLNYLNETYGIKIFVGTLEIPTLDIQWIPKNESEKVNEDKNTDRYEVCANQNKYLIYNFTNDTGADYFDVIYQNPISLKEMKKILNQNPYSETFPSIDAYEEVKIKLLNQYQLQGMINLPYMPRGMHYDRIILEPKLNYEELDEIPF